MYVMNIHRYPDSKYISFGRKHIGQQDMWFGDWKASYKVSSGLC